MRGRIPEMTLAMTLLWVWIGIVVVSIACWWLVKWWKARHPPPKPAPVLPYAHRLQRRFRERQPRGRPGSAGDTGPPPKKR